MTAKTLRVEHVRFPASKNTLYEKSLLAHLGDFRSDAKDAFSKYGGLLKAGEPVKVHAGNMVNSFPVKLTSAIAMNKRRPFCDRLSLTELADVADALNPLKTCSEPVPTYRKIKPNSDFRAISSFGPVHRTAQTIGRLMLQRFTYPHLRSWQYDFSGVAAAVEAVRDAILAGRKAIAHVDIQGFYPSFDGMALRQALPVPGKMVDNYLTARKLAIIPQGCPKHLLDDLLAKARSGVSHGSSVSPIIGADTISRIEWHPGPDVTAASYVDDLLLAAASEDLVTAQTKLVQAALTALPTGKFVGVVKYSGDAGNGFTYLGHEIRLVGDKVEISPAPGRWDDFVARAKPLRKQAETLVLKAALTDSEIDKRAALQAVCDLWELGNGWLAAFSMCDDIASYAELAIAPVNQMLSHLNSEIKALNPYKNGGVKWGYSD